MEIYYKSGKKVKSRQRGSLVHTKSYEKLVDIVGHVVPTIHAIPIHKHVFEFAP